MRLPDVRTTVSWSIVALAGGGAWVSYLHTYSAARAAGQPAACAVVYPVLTDVLVLAATVCLLHASQNKRKAAVPRWAFGLGVAATLFANVLYGARYGPLSAIVSGWPAVAFVTGVVLAHWLANGTGNPAVGRPAEGTSTGNLPVEDAKRAQDSHNGTTAPRISIIDERNTADPEAERGETGNPAVGRPGEGTSTGNLPVSKTDRVLDALQKARAKGESPTAASLAEQCSVSPTLARNVVRDNKVASNGHTS